MLDMLSPSDFEESERDEEYYIGTMNEYAERELLRFEKKADNERDQMEAEYFARPWEEIMMSSDESEESSSTNSIISNISNSSSESYLSRGRARSTSLESWESISAEQDLPKLMSSDSSDGNMSPFTTIKVSSDEEAESEAAEPEKSEMIITKRDDVSSSVMMKIIKKEKKKPDTNNSDTQIYDDDVCGSEATIMMIRSMLQIVCDILKEVSLAMPAEAVSEQYRGCKKMSGDSNGIINGSNHDKCDSVGQQRMTLLTQLIAMFGLVVLSSEMSTLIMADPNQQQQCTPSPDFMVDEEYHYCHSSSMFSSGYRFIGRGVRPPCGMGGNYDAANSFIHVRWLVTGVPNCFWHGNWRFNGDHIVGNVDDDEIDLNTHDSSEDGNNGYDDYEYLHRWSGFRPSMKIHVSSIMVPRPIKISVNVEHNNVLDRASVAWMDESQSMSHSTSSAAQGASGDNNNNNINNPMDEDEYYNEDHMMFVRMLHAAQYR